MEHIEFIVAIQAPQSYLQYCIIIRLPVIHMGFIVIPARPTLLLLM